MNVFHLEINVYIYCKKMKIKNVNPLRNMKYTHFKEFYIKEQSFSLLSILPHFATYTQYIKYLNVFVSLSSIHLLADS